MNSKTSLNRSLTQKMKVLNAINTYENMSGVICGKCKNALEALVNKRLPYQAVEVMVLVS